MSNKITTTVEAGFAFGYKALELTQDEAVSRIEAFEGPYKRPWIFTFTADGKGMMVTPEQLTQADWNAVDKVIITPALTACRPPC